MIYQFEINTLNSFFERLDVACRTAKTRLMRMVQDLSESM